MPDLTYQISATASGVGKDREGVISVDGHQVRFSAPANMGGKGIGASPETLLISAVTACYSLTLLAWLAKRKLPASGISVRTEGTVTGFPHNDTYAKVVVSPTIQGGDASRESEYRETALIARDHCFIGQTVAKSGTAYEVGTVAVES